MKLRLATILLGAGLAAPAAHADISAAARAFSDGQTAHLEGNYERAAQSFELAYNIAPSKEALRSAVRARLLSNQLPRAATLAHLLLAQFSDDAASAKLASEVIAEAKVRIARIAVTCAPGCTLVIGGRAISLDAAPSHVVFLAPGRQVIEITFDGERSVTRELTLKAGDDIGLPIEAPAALPVDKPAASAPAPAAPAQEHGLSPVFAIGGVVVTLALAGMTVWSGLDTNTAHDAYLVAPTHAGFVDGQSRQQRTNILLGASIAAGVGTAAIALLWTRWHGSPERMPDIAIGSPNGGLTVSFSGKF